MRAKEPFAILGGGGLGGGGSGEPYQGGNTEDRLSCHEAKISFPRIWHLTCRKSHGVSMVKLLCAN